MNFIVDWRILKIAFPFKKWLHPADYHITMAFLGHASEPDAKRSMKSRPNGALEHEASV